MVSLYPFEKGLRANVADVVKGTLEHLPDDSVLAINPSRKEVEVEATFIYGYDGSGKFGLSLQSKLNIC